MKTGKIERDGEKDAKNHRVTILVVCAHTHILYVLPSLKRRMYVRKYFADYGIVNNVCTSDRFNFRICLKLLSQLEPTFIYINP